MGKFKTALNKMKNKGVEFWDEDDYRKFLNSVGIKEEFLDELS